MDRTQWASGCYRPVFGKFNEGYIDFLLDQSREAILEAVGNL
jgi:hypothetical protein